MKTPDLVQFVESCFSDCDTMPAMLWAILCKLVVFTIMVSVVGYWLTEIFK